MKPCTAEDFDRPAVIKSCAYGTTGKSAGHYWPQGISPERAGFADYGIDGLRPSLWRAKEDE